ncbi:MAG: hypothetical protein KKE02_04740 [Alphaproteobacteria bacterium]|nr:hypothetical protein [Alphaproteobacteria bacterium]MBU1513727.1 hypothetical protein [Alphaproteobacteria bacterium]MBU2094628.1 hypothetical protein [Alphaproteobacteria bacterium]MBU2150303.1 hypothetical protein [Alphaproteobacteria bacterium]MBU2309168.1 hypothetical protein [Alphaproteobacteria bacterium]
MSDAVFQRNPAVRRIGSSKRAGRLPVSYGLAIAAAASLSLWGGIFWIAARLLG